MRKAAFPLILVVLAVVSLFSGCASSKTEGNTTIKKDFASFTRIEVEGIFEVEVAQASSFSTTVIANKDFVDYVAFLQEGDKLKIYLNPRYVFTDFTAGTKTLKAIITLPVLQGLSLSGANKGTVTGFKSSQDFTLRVLGANSLALDNIEVGNVMFEISGASKVIGSMKTSDARFKVSGASKLELVGSANNMILDAAGASKISLAEFVLDNAQINLSGASEATLNVKERLTPFLSDAATLYFLGNPAIGDIRVSGASTIKHK